MKNRFLTAPCLAGFALTIAPLIYFLPAIWGAIVLCPDDALIFNLPIRTAAAAMIRAGELPLWNPYIFGGMPLFASAQGGLLLPLNWFFLLCGPRAAMNLAVLTTYAAAGLGAFLYARRTGASVLGAFVTGFVWQTSGFLIAQIGHTNVIQVASILPWLLWSIDGYSATGQRSRGVLVALFVALQVFAGHPQTLVYSLLLAGVYTVALAVAERDRVRRSFRLQALVMLVLGLGLATVQIWPTLELLRQSVRSETSYEFFTSFSLPPVFLLTYLAPYIVGGGDGTLFRAPYIGEAFYGEYIGYVGLAPLALAILAPFVRRDRVTIFWVCALVVCGALAFGRFLPFELYRLVYHLPVLNLFRVPARHLLEVTFALAVLAGRAVTFLPQSRARADAVWRAALVSLGLVLLTVAAVTVFRPIEFHLGRAAPVTILRAPELFLPLLVAILSAWALVRFARGRSGARTLLVAVLVGDLCLWGQFSGWRTSSPRRDHPIFKGPGVVKLLHQRAGAHPGNFRILTLEQPLPTMEASANTPASGPFDVALQPDTYMMHRLENAAGYDGFGLARQSRLAGDMKVWGAFPDPARSLLVSRELDLLNVRYLIARAPHAIAPEILPAPTKIGDLAFGENDLGLASLEAGMRIDFNTPAIGVTRVALLTNLSWSAESPDGTKVGTVTLRAQDGRSWRFELRAGLETSEWAWDRPDVRAIIRHARAPVGLSSEVQEPQGSYSSHNYVASFALPAKAEIIGGSIEGPTNAEATKISLSILRVSLMDEPNGAAIPLRKEWMSEKTRGPVEPSATGSKWQLLKQSGAVVIHENTQALPRAWLATEARALSDKHKLSVIRTGKFSDGAAWDPRRTVLLNKAPDAPLSATSEIGKAEIINYRPNRIDVATHSAAPSFLVLSENHYPGWQATMDGRRTGIVRADYNLRAVPLPAGEHRVQFIYRPRSVLGGLLISLLSGLVLFVWCRLAPRA